MNKLSEEHHLHPDSDGFSSAAEFQLGQDLEEYMAGVEDCNKGLLEVGARVSIIGLRLQSVLVSSQYDSEALAGLTNSVDSMCKEDRLCTSAFTSASCFVIVD